ncbi:MAG: hypothetical protein PWP23_2110 [Candidatus Sumerlaeota bacterium]|nr:hypothetical protein [Candidatus Sumerlaeota bacterium]
MPAKLLISDVDGCLCPEESAAWDLDVFGRLAHAARDAASSTGAIAPLTLCTGRPQPYVEVLMKVFDIRLPAICENGAVIYSLADNAATFGPGVTARKLAGLHAVRDYIEDHLLPKAPGVVRQYGKEAQLSLYSATPDRLRTLDEAIHLFIEREGLPPLVINASHYYLNISLEGVDKGGAVAWLLGKLGVEKHEAVGIGDTEGDLPLRANVGFFACPANAQASIRNVADYVSPFPTGEGVLDILQRPECARG